MHFLTKAEFDRLPTLEKAAYLERAVAQWTRGAPPSRGQEESGKSRDAGRAARDEEDRDHR